METKTKKGIALAITAAALYALNAPLSKVLLNSLPPTLTAGLLYIGAGLGMLPVALLRRFKKGGQPEARLTRAELPYTVLMIVLDIAAPICLLIGLRSTPAASASLLNNFEIVATAVLALVLFGEKISPRLWLGILTITASCALLSFEGTAGLKLSGGSLFILLASVCWGLENNCTRKLSAKDPMEIVLLKGIFSGIGSLCIGFFAGERITSPKSAAAALAVGFLAYGMSIFFYVYAQRFIGAARTGTYYAVSPFIAVILSFILFHEMPAATYFVALGLMMVGAWLASDDKPIFKRTKP